MTPFRDARLSWLRPQLLFALAIAGPAASQVPPGHLVAVVQLTGAVTPELGVSDPLSGSYTRLGGALGGLVAQRAIPGPGGTLLLGGAASGGGSALRSASMSGLRVQALTTLASGLQGSVRALALLPDQSVLVCTSFTIYHVSTAGSVTPLARPVSAVGCLDAAIGPGVAAVLVRPGGGARAAIYAVDTSTFNISIHPLTIPTATSIAYSPASGGYLIGDAAGDVYLIDAQRFTQVVWLRTQLGQIDRIARNVDQQNHVLAAAGALHTMVGRQLSTSTTITGAANIADLGYQPFASSFAEYGSGCIGSNGSPPHLAAIGRPFPGNTTFGITLQRARPSSAAILVLGLTASNLDLTALGMPGCRLLLVPGPSMPSGTSRLGRTLLPLPLPPLSALAGSRVRCQWFVLDPVNGLRLVASNGGLLRV